MNLCASSCFTVLVMLAAAWLARGQEVENQREFSYDDRSPVGPSHWGKIRPEWRTCNSGAMQSPIDLLHERVELVSDSGTLIRDYRPSNATFVNRGRDIMLKWTSGAGNIYINGTPYQLSQCHWHSPSEHTINGKRFDLEIHLVHQDAKGRTAVVGAVYKTGSSDDSFLSKLEPDFRALARSRETVRSVGVIDPRDIQIKSMMYYSYTGSLTLPPCTQNVTWIVVTRVRTVTRQQVRLIREAVQDGSDVNARPLQPLNKRSVKFFVCIFFHAFTTWCS